MQADNAENLMLCNLYIIKLDESSQMVSVCIHPLRKEKYLGWKAEHALVIWWRCKVEALVRCFVVWLNIVCHSLLGIWGWGVQRHNVEQWGRNVGIWWVGSGPVWGIECFKRKGRQTNRLGNKLQAENDRGVMLLISSLLWDTFIKEADDCLFCIQNNKHC